MRKFICTLFVLMSVIFVADAQEFWYEGVHYRAIDYFNVEVIQGGDSIYTGNIVIPRFVFYQTVDDQGVTHSEEFMVTAIADSAFYKCTGLTGILFPKSLDYIGNYAFYDCRALTSVDFPAPLREIKRCAFYKCSRLTSVTFPNTLKTIGHDSFGFCPYLTGVTLPNSLTYLDEFAFYHCLRLNSIVIPDSITVLNTGVFAECGMTSVTFPPNLQKICDRAFDYDCFDTIVIPNTVTELKGAPFRNNSYLKDIQIPNTINYLSSAFLEGCSSLEKFVVPDSVKILPFWMFHYCSSLKTVILNDALETIASDCFSGCSALEEIVIPNKVTEIDAYAFTGCTKLRTITFGKSLEWIGNNSFDDTKLESIVSLNTTPPNAFDWTFSRFFETTTLYVPRQSVEAYRANDAWSGFLNIVGIDVDPDPGDINGDGSINISDVTGLINLLLNGGELPAYADFNADGIVNIKDVTDLINWLLNGN